MVSVVSFEAGSQLYGILLIDFERMEKSLQHTFVTTSHDRPLSEVNKPRLQVGLAIYGRYLIMPTGVIGTECVNKLKFYFYHVEIF
jgi:hypothetical protein